MRLTQSHAFSLHHLAWLSLVASFAGCFTTREITVDYPLEPSVVAAINRGGEKAIVVLSENERAAVTGLTVDSMMARWLDGEWRATPLVNLQSVTFIDPDEPSGQTVNIALYSVAGFAVIGLIDGIVQKRASVIGNELVVGACVGGVVLLNYDRLEPMTRPRVRYTLRPPHSPAEWARREADRLRLEPSARSTISDLNTETRRLRIEPGILFGRGNSVNPESDASHPFVLGGGVSFGVRFWERAETGFEFALASHSFGRAKSDERVTRMTMMLTFTMFPLESSGLFVRGGAGYGLYSAFGTYTGPIVTEPPVTPATVTASGIAFCLGGGYDVRLGDAWSLRPALRYTITPLSGLELNDKVVLATGKTSSLLTMSLSLAFKGVM